jgi:IMP cyclohydrolase
MEIERADEMTVADHAQANFESHIERNSYPGRGLLVGRSSEDDSWLFVYFIMGRSQHSRNRRFDAEASVLRTVPVDLGLVEDPSLIIYEAMLEQPSVYLVSNGDQTRTIADALAEGGTFDAALEGREREPDAPNYTPRISAMLDLRGVGPVLQMNILKANRADPEATDRITFRPAPPPAGYGLLLTTYQGDGSPLPSFEGDPILVPCSGTPEEILERYWKALNQDNRISLAVKRIPADGTPSTLYTENRY